MKKARKTVKKPKGIEGIPRQMLKVIERVQEGIQRTGWFAIATSGAKGTELAFSYSIGMQASWNAPDILIVGLDASTAKSYLDHAADRAQGPDGSIKAGHLPGFFGEVDGWAIEISEADFVEHFRISGVLYPEARKGLQLIFPDAKGRFPWDASSDYFGKVPLLGSPPSLN